MMIDALESVTAITSAGAASGFQLRFSGQQQQVGTNTIFLIAVGQKHSAGTRRRCAWC